MSPKKLLLIQPLLPSYRFSLIQGLRERYALRIAADPGGEELGHKTQSHADLVPTATKTFLGGRLTYQVGAIRALLSFRPDAVMTFGNVRCLSVWIVLLLCKLMRIPCYAHGHGLYRRLPVGITHAITYRAMTWLAAGYVCYTDFSRETLLEIGCTPEKLHVAENTVQLAASVQPRERSYSEPGVLFIGRIRERANLDVLLRAVEAMVADGHEIELHIIGDGPARRHLQAQFAASHVKWHGAIHDESDIAEISKRCRIGCYPGAAGLSVVHLFGLSLPPLIDEDLTQHMGPEPSYVKNMHNGFTFPAKGLAEKLREAWALPPSELKRVGECAYAKYLSLNMPPLHARVARIIG